MLRYKGIFVLILSIGIGVCFFLGKSTMCKNKKELAVIANVSDLILLFPKTVDEIRDRAACYIEETKKIIDDIINVPDEQRTFENTARALDHAVSYSDLIIFREVLLITEMVYPDELMRKKAHEAYIKMNEFFVDTVANNKKLYVAFKAYVDKNAKKEQLNAEQLYYLQETMDDFKRHGLNLPEDCLKELRTLNKKIASLTLAFDANIATDNRTIVVNRDGLKGLDDDFINNLKKTDDGSYILGIDSPTYMNIMTHCSVEDTRKRLFYAYANRAYPANDTLLQEMIAKRDELAHKLGFSSYAALDLDNEMAKKPEHVQKFLDKLLVKVAIKGQEEFDCLTADLPESVSLTKENKFKPWDLAYTKSYYKKKHFDIDERAIAEYFPMEKTIDKLLDIYKQFFSLDFKICPIKGLWHEDVQLVEVFDREKKQSIGYLLLDLYPRPNKYSHACHDTIIPAVTSKKQDELLPSLSVVIANFPKSTPNKPSLLWRNDVSTFFHELGHALHALLGRTEMASFSGTNTKIDFVEMPSQMLEEWMCDKGILSTISSHYKTGEPLPDELINKILEIKNIMSGFFVQGQGLLSYLSLDCFNSGSKVDVYDLMRSLDRDIERHVQFEPNDHNYASFGHLTEYGAKYYSYLWSKVYALDLFSIIKEHGLLDPEIGRRFKNEILAKGGSVEPIILLQAFLGRKPNQKAFLKDLGISV